MSKVMMISDCHFGHKNIWRFREQVFDSEDNDNQLTYNILSLCGKRDTLWMLGDCFLSVDSIDILRKLKRHIGYIHFVLGNHDTQRKHWCEIILPAVKENLFDSVHGVVKYNGSWLTHTPMHPTELYGKINIHGHTHNTTIDDKRYVNICPENTDMKPVNFQDIKAGWRGVDRLTKMNYYASDL